MPRTEKNREQRSAAHQVNFPRLDMVLDSSPALIRRNILLHRVVCHPPHRERMEKEEWKEEELQGFCGSQAGGREQLTWRVMTRGMGFMGTKSMAMMSDLFGMFLAQTCAHEPGAAHRSRHTLDLASRSYFLLS